MNHPIRSCLVPCRAAGRCYKTVGHSPSGRDTTGFIPFGFDLTPYLLADGPNVIAVRIDNRSDQQFSGDTPRHHPNWHPPHGGIYRDVVLHVVDPVHGNLPLFAYLETEGIYAWVESLTVDREGRVVAESTGRAPRHP